MLIRILIATDSEKRSRRIRRLLPPADILASVARPSEIWERLGRESVDVLIAAYDALDEPISDTIAAVRKLPDQPEVIVLIRHEDPETRARMQAAGAFATVWEGLGEDALRQSLETLIRRSRESGMTPLRAEERQYVARLSEFSTRSPAMQELLNLARRVVTTDSSLLIVGETGVGKEWLARAIHAEGSRSSSPFIAVNCAAIPETLLESELFGHERGAFTGAIRSRRGFFELAHRGTIFLDEIAEMPFHLQAKLLRAIQERRIQRVGSEDLIELDVRIIAATNQNLEEAMQESRFRRDLFYRLGVVILRIPPLRERPQDIPDLLLQYLDRFRYQHSHSVAGVTPEAMQALVAYDWPGNVRELINVIERAILLASSDEISLRELPESIATSRSSPRSSEVALAVEDDAFALSLNDAKDRIIDRFEREYLERLLTRTAGRINDTASLAGIDTRTLYNKMQRFGLRKEDFRPTRHPRSANN